MPVSYRQACPALGPDRTETFRACRIQIMVVVEADNADASEADARAEGYASLEELHAAHPLEQRSWVIRFGVIHDEVRLLTRDIIPGKQGPYTDVHANAMDELEAVDDDYLDLFAKRARDREYERQQERRRALGELSFDEELDILTREARERHIDIRDELRAIRRWADHTARKLQLTRIRTKLGYSRPTHLDTLTGSALSDGRSQ